MPLAPACFPNPARAGDVIHLRLPVDEAVLLELFDPQGGWIGGREIAGGPGASLALEELMGPRPSAGTYFIRLVPRSGAGQRSERIVVLAR